MPKFESVNITRNRAFAARRNLRQRVNANTGADCKKASVDAVPRMFFYSASTDERMKKMSLMEKLTADMKDAMKQGEKERLSVIRLVRGAVRQAEIDGKKTLNDDEIIGVITKEVKMRRDSIEEFERGGRADLVDKTKAEIDILMPYLPAQLSADEVKKIVEEAVAEVGAATAKDMGKVMGVLMPRVKGRADGKLVNEIVRSLLK